MSHSAPPVTPHQPKREPRLVWLVLLLAAGVLITAAWGLALVSLAWSLLAVIV